MVGVERASHDGTSESNIPKNAKKNVDHANPVTWWLNDDLDCDQELRLPQKSRGCEVKNRLIQPIL